MQKPFIAKYKSVLGLSKVLEICTFLFLYAKPDLIADIFFIGVLPSL